METISPLSIKISDYDYALPDERIAKYPKQRRDTSKLLTYVHGAIGEDQFANLPNLLPSGALMVFNNTRVIQARLHFRKNTGALIEVFLLEPFMPTNYEQTFQQTERCTWLCMVGNLKKWKEGQLVRTVPVGQHSVSLTATRKEEQGGSHIVEFTWDNRDVNFAQLLDAAGELPIPPYLNRSTEENDKQTYQTVYSKIKGSVAAPTAGLHFTQDVLQEIDRRGIHRTEVTLHVGAGTFKPVKSQEIKDHDMHTEYISVSRSTLEALIAHHAQAIAVGTTSVRTLESLYYMGLKLHARGSYAENQDLHVGQWEPYAPQPSIQPTTALRHLLNYMDYNHLELINSSTQIIIVPGYKYQIVKALITNFHQPKSTLLLLVSALVGERWRDIYDYALAHQFRFLSYGDSSLIVP